MNIQLLVGSMLVVLAASSSADNTALIHNSHNLPGLLSQAHSLDTAAPVSQPSTIGSPLLIAGILGEQGAEDLYFEHHRSNSNSISFSQHADDQWIESCGN